MTNARFGRFLQGYAAYVEPAGFVKIREISLSIRLPQSWVSHVFSGSDHDIRLDISGRNLYTWTKYKGYDPEVSNFSNQNLGRFQDVTPYPPSRSIFVSVTANY